MIVSVIVVDIQSLTISYNFE